MLRRLIAWIDARLQSRYLPRIECPECGERFVVEHTLEIVTRADGSQELVSEANIDTLWNHWAAGHKG